MDDAARRKKIEQLGDELYDALRARRTLAPLTELLALARPFLAPRGVCCFLKGRRVEEELTAARKSWRFASELQPSRSDEHGRVVLIERLQDVRQD